MLEYEDYWVTATYSDSGETWEEHVGELELRKISSHQDMPDSLEIDGVEYFPKF